MSCQLFTLWAISWRIFLIVVVLVGRPAVGMASCFDLGDPDPLNAMGLCHSRYKMECGRRLALALMSLLPPNLGKEMAEPAVVAPAPVPPGPTIKSAAAVSCRDATGIYMRSLPDAQSLLMTFIFVGTARWRAGRSSS